MNTDRSIAAQIVELIRAEGLGIGSHLPAQMLADRLRVSRSPINDALVFLHENGLLKHVHNRGFFIAKAVTAWCPDMTSQLGLSDPDVTTTAYFRIADDRLKGLLPDEFPEQLIKTQYGLTSTQATAVLGRIAREGWADRRPGYGWQFSSMLTDSEALLKSYRLRAALEPAALLEPGYRLDASVLERCRAAELYLLDGGIETSTVDQLHERGVRFHESIVEASGNSFFVESIRRVNRVRRLLSYRSMQDRDRYTEHCKQHLRILDLLERERNEEASHALREHLHHTLSALSNITSILGP
ncbi:transcriptional regulator, GntR family [Burkholderia sp. CF099]|nr:transcriptional regulator, GntR family [Burkholderia sp. CF099]